MKNEKLNEKIIKNQLEFFKNMKKIEKEIIYLKVENYTRTRRIFN